MSKRSPRLLIEDILEAAQKIRKYTAGLTFEEFALDDKTVDAVVRNFEIIGEAASRLPDEFRDSNPAIDWRRIRGFRNRIIHDYFGIDQSIVWNIVQNNLAQLTDELTELQQRLQD